MVAMSAPSASAVSLSHVLDSHDGHRHGHGHDPSHRHHHHCPPGTHDLRYCELD
jgi:hypothetical protein